MFSLVNMSNLLLDSEVTRLCLNRGSTPIIFALSSRKDLDDSSTYSTGLDEKSGHILVITFSNFTWYKILATPFIHNVPKASARFSTASLTSSRPTLKTPSIAKI